PPRSGRAGRGCGRWGSPGPHRRGRGSPRTSSPALPRARPGRPSEPPLGRAGATVDRMSDHRRPPEAVGSALRSGFAEVAATLLGRSYCQVIPSCYRRVRAWASGELGPPAAARERKPSMGHYKSNVRDLEFNLFEVFKVQEQLGKGAFEQTDADTVRGVLQELNELATRPLADSFADGDRNPAKFDPETHSVTLPEGFKKSFKQIMDGEWWRLSLPVELGGYGIPSTVEWAAAELILGANPPIYMYMAGPNFATILWRNGTEEQRRWAEIMIERGWGATMVLT